MTDVPYGARTRDDGEAGPLARLSTRNRRFRTSVARRLRYFGWALLTVVAMLSVVIPAARASEPDVELHFFWREGCGHCDAQKPVLERLGAEHPIRIVSHDVGRDPEARAYLGELGEALGFEPRAVPVTVIGHRYWVGFTPALEAQLQEAVLECLVGGCPAPGTPTSGPAPSQPASPPSISVPGLGELDLAGRSLLVSTLIIAFVDGFNPCSLWVLSILLSLVISVRSRARIFLVGFTFLTITALVYGLFIVGLFQFFALLKWIDGARIVVALFALFFAVVNIKDYFWFKKGLSFTIADKHKPKIYKRIRKILSKRSTAALLAATATMALGVSIMELPCTAGFPIVWSKMVSARDVGTAEFAGLLGAYLLVYLLDELFVFVTVVVTLRMSRMQEKHGRILKLIGGGVMLALAAILLVRPQVMDDLAGSLIVFALAFAAVGLVLLLHRVVLPRFGIVLGSEDLPDRREP
jgi:thiol-disulfide isomerase/thioredoxin